MKKVPDQALTHGGKFHADDVFSTALLRFLHPGIQITRAFQVPEGYEGLVYDMGGGPFDHHQADAPVRENGIPYAAFGLLWRKFGAGFFPAGFSQEELQKEMNFFDEKFIQPLDNDDNTGCGDPLAAVIGLFNPAWDSERPADECFEEAVRFALTILQKKFDAICSIHRAKEMVWKAYEERQDGVVILPTFAPWKMLLVPSEAEFVIYPSQRGGYNAQAVPEETETGELVLRYPFPERWRGASPEELVSLSGIASLSFCHNTGFLAAAGNLEDMVKACRLAKQEIEGGGKEK